MTDHLPIRSGRIVVTVALALGYLLVSAGGVFAHSEGGDPLTDDQQKCSNGALKDWGKSSKVGNKGIQACLKNYAKGKPLDAGNPAIDTLEECLVNDPKGKVQKQKDKTSANFDKNCGGPNRDGIDGEGFPQMPPEYGATDPVTVSAAAAQQQSDIAHDIFGESLDAGQMANNTGGGDSADAAKCQQKVMKTISKCVATREKQFLKCTKTHLADTGIYGLIYDIGDLALCYDGLDPFKIQKKCAGVPGQGMQKEVQKCVDKVDDRTLSELFPGCGSDIVSEVTVCLDESARCRFCQSMNASVGANRDCDLFDDAVANESCEICSVSTGYPSTMAAIQNVIFDSPTYGCSSALCHGVAAQGGLILTDDPNTPVVESHANLIGVAGQGASPPLDRVEPAEPSLSFLFNKVAAGVDPNHPTGGGSPMPTGGAPALTPEHLEAMRLWIRGGAPEDLTVEGTALLLGSCLPEPDPLTIPVPDPPAAGTGVQLTQTPWPLPSESENEVCMPILYDFVGTGLVPASALVACPDEFLPGRCTGGTNDPDDDACIDLTDCPDQGGGTLCDLTLGNGNNPTGTCFAYKNELLQQDPQSHHSIIHIYTGTYDTTDAGWGSFTYKFTDPNNPLNGTACDPTVVGATGQHDGCSGDAQETIACLGFGPPDYTFGGGIGIGTGGTAPQITAVQEPYYLQEYPAGVYSVLPMAGIIVWNSHAFNLTQTDSTLSAYLNLDFALGAGEQVSELEAIFDAGSIFWAPLLDPDNTVPPFTTREFCRTYTIPPDAELFELSSHTHQMGVLWRTWAPPNAPCLPGPLCTARVDLPMYVSTDYADPLQLEFDPPISHSGGLSVADRTYLYCANYDNGSTPGSPPIKRQSTSVSPPLGLPFGGPCPDAELQCIGPNEGTPCFGDDALCDSAPAAGDGDCDACPVRGGVTTTDEMFILLGDYFIP